MPLNFPGKAPSLELGALSPAFCRSVFALSDLMAQPPGAASPDVQRRAAWAQLFMYVQGLRPSLTEPLTARAKAGLNAILAPHAAGCRPRRPMPSSTARPRRSTCRR